MERVEMYNKIGDYFLDLANQSYETGRIGRTIFYATFARGLYKNVENLNKIARCNSFIPSGIIEKEKEQELDGRIMESASKIIDFLEQMIKEEPQKSPEECLEEAINHIDARWKGRFAQRGFI